MAEKLIIDWKEYNQIVEKLAIQIYDSGFKPNLLIGIMRGGAPIIDVPVSYTHLRAHET